jgi:hypothetical protein
MSAPQGPPLYKGEPLDAERGPGLGCFWLQTGLLAILLVLTPLTVVWAWDPAISAALLIVTLILLLFAGQTVIFLLRLVAVDRRSRRRPLAPDARPTVGQLEEQPTASPAGRPGAPAEGVQADDPGAPTTPVPLEDAGQAVDPQAQDQAADRGAGPDRA